MKQAYLTSSMHSVAKDMCKLLPPRPRILAITTPSETQKDIDWLETDLLSMQQASCHIDRYTISGKNRATLQKDLHSYKYIYVSGGDTFHMLKQSITSGFHGLIQDLVCNQGKIYIGTSAGSIIAGPTLPRYLIPHGQHTINNIGFGIVNIVCIPHWGRQDCKQEYLNKRLKQVYSADESPMILLSDTTFMHVEGEHIQLFQVNQPTSL